jgi:hypothetical protein
VLNWSGKVFFSLKSLITVMFGGSMQRAEV